jgi:hypothetical protein
MLQLENNLQNLDFYIGKWIDYPWTRGIHPDDVIHSDEFNKKEGKFSIGLAHCIAVENEYLVLKTKDDVFKVKYWDSMSVRPTPEFAWYDEVNEIDRPEVRGIVDKIIWHSKDKEYKYFLIVDGKPKSRRYNPNELQLYRSAGDPAI